MSGHAHTLPAPCDIDRGNAQEVSPAAAGLRNWTARAYRRGRRARWASGRRSRSRPEPSSSGRYGLTAPFAVVARCQIGQLREDVAVNAAVRYSPVVMHGVFPGSRTLTKDLINDAREGRGGVAYNTVLGSVFFRLMRSYNEFPLTWFPAPVIWVQPASLVNPPVQCVEVDFEDENAVK
jgi:hypothetical protein